MLADWTAARQAMADAGVLIDCAPLQPTAASTTVRVRDGETLLTDGPAARAELLTRVGRHADAARAYEAALRLPMSTPERAFVERRLAALA